ncbi:MAG: NAD-dependent DNA ligase LigA [Clostridiales bacterium]|nr:NAD-dependent DNA ligase LigA [Clostridiales bacterium]
MKELLSILNEAARAYYQEDREIISNLEYDKLYDELLSLEKESNTILAGSPTVKVGYEVLSALPKEAHDKPMLSLDKTKSPEALEAWLMDKEGLLSWKLDGLTVVLTYNEGVLTKAVTRGNGEIGEVISNNARVFKNLPIRINYMGELILRGEAVIKYSDFNKINAEITEVDAKYKNPRNLCSGSVRQLNNEITAKRMVNFYGFTLVKADGIDFKNSREKQLEWLSAQGFEIVEYKKVTKDNISDVIKDYAEAVTSHDLPSDGLVLLYDDISYGDSLGTTAKFPRDSIAFKWADEIGTTKLITIEWSPSRTGLINPVAIFEPVELEGTTVSRASVHNISILEALALGEGDTIEVYKANMIIPQIADNLTRSGSIEIPKECPACGGHTELFQINDVKTLYCTNDECSAKKIKGFSHFVGRNAMNIEGFSDETLNKFIEQGFIKEYADIYHLDDYKEEILSIRGFKEKAYNNIVAAVEASRDVSLPKLIYSLGIANIGLANAKMICKSFDNDLEKMRKATIEELTTVEGIGDVIGQAFVDYFLDEKKMAEFDKLLQELKIQTDLASSNQDLLNLTFVITGSLEHFENRDALKEVIESRGGKVTGSVTSKTNYLINNDSESSSSKNKKAKELNIPILSEEEFISLG